MPPTKSQTLCSLIQRVAEAPQSAEMNDALYDFMQYVFPRMRRPIACWLEERRVGGPDGMIHEVDDVLNELLQRVCKTAGQFKGQSEGEAWSWLRKVAVRLIEDSAKTPRRRLWLLVERLWAMGYDHESWNLNAMPRELDDE